MRTKKVAWSSTFLRTIFSAWADFFLTIQVVMRMLKGEKLYQSGKVSMLETGLYFIRRLLRVHISWTQYFLSWSLKHKFFSLVVRHICLSCCVPFLSYLSEYSPDSFQSYNYARASSVTGVIFKQIKLIMRKENVNSYHPPFFNDRFEWKFYYHLRMRAKDRMFVWILNLKGKITS